ncbi:INO80 complex subunit B-like [Carassius carassius]|uniref:INO80 complex subunit B-like n=1 Tax=Carassius carassius TaxID=217509 RepID=UPI002868BB6D|nr:INO80 complex subunit B-like [Carassius carassius]
MSVFLLVIPDEDMDSFPVMDMDSLLGGPMNEEQRWLDVLEKGQLDENRELKKEMSLLTARQVSHKPPSQSTLELPMVYKKELTAESKERARKRRLQATKKPERLTKTSKAKIKSMKEHKLPVVRYSSNAQSAAILYPAGIPVSTPTAPAEPPPAPLRCSNMKIYSCSRTGTPLCSLEYYRKNLRLVQEVA